MQPTVIVVVVVIIIIIIIIITVFFEKSSFPIWFISTLLHIKHPPLQKRFNQLTAARDFKT
jgi:hypothetical protein